MFMYHSYIEPITKYPYRYELGPATEKTWYLRLFAQRFLQLRSNIWQGFHSQQDEKTYNMTGLFRVVSCLLLRAAFKDKT